jgi:hypothetical protein
MKKPKINITIIKEDLGYSAHTTIGNKFIGTQGDTFDELKNEILDAVNLSFEKEGFVYTEDEISLVPDLESFYEFYKGINPKVLSERTGMDQSLLSQYIKGTKKPSAAQTRRIWQGVQQIGKELSEVRFFL